MEECQKDQNANMNSQNIIYAIAAILGLVVAVFLTFHSEFGRCGFAHVMIGVSSGVIAFGAYIVGHIIVHFKPFQSLARVCTILAIILFFSFFSLFTGLYIQKQDIAKAKEFCEGLIPLLDAYQQEKGRYPAGLNTILSKDQKLPVLLRGADFEYSGKEDTFSFSFSDPGSVMFGGWAYNNKHREWYYWD